MEAVLKSTVDAAKIDQAFAELPRPFQGDPPAGVVVVVAVVVLAHVMCHERVEEGREASETSTAPDPTQNKTYKGRGCHLFLGCISSFIKSSTGAQ